jgi:tungstate transport system ATP-binding protein
MKIHITNLKKRFNDKLILDIEKIEIEKGLQCVIGENGCGKTTLLNIIAGQLHYDSGIVDYNNKPFSKLLAKDITLVPQKPYMLDRSVYGNIAYPLKLRKMSKNQINYEIDKILDYLDLMPLKHQKATNLSVGETQKIALIRAMIFKPKLLLLDEPTSNIDNKAIIKVETLIREYAKDNTVIMVTHSLTQVQRLTNRIIKL